MSDHPPETVAVDGASTERPHRNTLAVAAAAAANRRLAAAATTAAAGRRRPETVAAGRGVSVSGRVSAAQAAERTGTTISNELLQISKRLAQAIVGRTNDNTVDGGRGVAAAAAAAAAGNRNAATNYNNNRSCGSNNRNGNVIDQLIKNELETLKLYGLPQQHFGPRQTFSDFYNALLMHCSDDDCKVTKKYDDLNDTLLLAQYGGKTMNNDNQNTTENTNTTSRITKVDLSWRFLRTLSEFQRILLFQLIGKLPNLIELAVEAIGPCQAIISFLKEINDKRNSTLKSLRIGALRIRNNNDIVDFAKVLEQNQSLIFFSIANIRTKVSGTYRMDHNGEMWFIEQQQQEGEEPTNNDNEAITRKTTRTVVDPIFHAISRIPTIRWVQIQFDTGSQNINNNNNIFGQQQNRNQATATATANNDKGFARIQEKSILQLLSRRSKTMTFLVLHACNLDDDHCIAISQYLRNSNNGSVLEHLSITEKKEKKLENSITGSSGAVTSIGYRALCNALQYNYVLQELYTPVAASSYNNAFDAGVYSQRFLERKGLKTLQKEEEWLIMDYRIMMDLYLYLNQKGRGKLLLADLTQTTRASDTASAEQQQHTMDNDSGSSKSDWIELLSREGCSNINIFYHLLQMNPSLCYQY